MRALLRLLQGAPPTVLPSLWNLHQRVADSMCTYDPHTCTTMPPPQLPWPVFWLLLHHSGKHRFCVGSKPPFRWLIEDIKQFMNKMQWRLHYSGCERPGPPFRVKGRLTPPCNFEVHPDFKPWSAHFRRVLLATASAQAKQRRTTNVYGLIRLAHNLLKTIPFFDVKNDNDNGFAFIHRDEATQLECMSLPDKSSCQSVLHL